MQITQPITVYRTEKGAITFTTGSGSEKIIGDIKEAFTGLLEQKDFDDIMGKGFHDTALGILEGRINFIIK